MDSRCHRAPLAASVQSVGRISAPTSQRPGELDTVVNTVLYVPGW